MDCVSTGNALIDESNPPTPLAYKRRTRPEGSAKRTRRQNEHSLHPAQSIGADVEQVAAVVRVFQLCHEGDNASAATAPTISKDESDLSCSARASAWSARGGGGGRVEPDGDGGGEVR